MTKPALVASCVLVAAATCLLVTKDLRAQDPFGGGDPFGNAGAGSADPFGDPAAGDEAGMGTFGTPAFGNGAPPTDRTASEPLSADDPDPVVRLLRAAPPKTTQQWADALTWMARIKRWDEIKRLLDELRAENWSLERQGELARAGGSSLWLRLRVDEASLTPEQLQLVRDIQSAPAKLARDAAAIDRWIEQLASPHAGERRLAQLRLQDGSLTAVQRLVDRLLQGDPQIAPALLAATVVEFGPDGRDALRAACLVRDPERAGRVVLALAELPTSGFAAELAAGLASRLLPPDVQAELAERLLEKYGSLPEVPAIHAYLTQRFEQALANYQQKRTSGSSFPSLVWRPSVDGQTIQLVEAPASHRELERLAQLAALRMLLKVATPEDSIANGVALLQRAYQLAPTASLGEISSQLLVGFDESLSTEERYWQQVFERADELQMHGAAIRALQLLSEHAVQGDFPPPLGFLSELLNDPRPIIRYTALQAIAKLDPKEAFAGAETAIDTAIEMAGLAAGPQALVVGLQSELRLAAGHQLQQQTGAEVVFANSGKAALLALSGRAPIELIVIVDRVADLSVYELLQRLRSTQNGQSLPIAVLTERLYQHELRLINAMPGVFSSVLTQDPSQMERVLSKLLDGLDTSPLSAADRAEFAVTAGRFLAKISQDREQYAFYPISDWREQLVGLQGGLSTSGRMNVLAAVGSADGQESLAAMAANAGLSPAERMDAARAFGTSVRRFGTLLPREAVKQTYDLYNQLGPNDPATAQALGLILDVTEAQAGQAAWPEGL